MYRQQTTLASVTEYKADNALNFLLLFVWHAQLKWALASDVRFIQLNITRPSWFFPQDRWICERMVETGVPDGYNERFYLRQAQADGSELYCLKESAIVFFCFLFFSVSKVRWERNGQTYLNCRLLVTVQKGLFWISVDWNSKWRNLCFPLIAFGLLLYVSVLYCGVHVTIIEGQTL